MVSNIRNFLSGMRRSGLDIDPDYAAIMIAVPVCAGKKAVDLSRIIMLFAALMFALVLAGCDRRTDIADSAGAYDDAENWAAFGRTPGAQSFSPLDGINSGNVEKLGLVWSYDLQPGNAVSEPIAVDGVIYTATGYSVVTALDAVSGRELWRYDPKAPQVAGKKLAYSWGIRGLAYDDGRIFVGTVDGRLISLEADTGNLAWSEQTTEPGDDRYITGPPRVFDGKVIIGHGGADVGKTRGYVTAYDGRSGKQVWRFYTVPGDPANGFESKAMEMAAKTWAGEWWKLGGGGTVWNAISYDAELDTVIIGVGNGWPWDRKTRSADRGDNLFLASLVGLDGKTGAYKWHYQVNPGESWDYSASMDIVLANVKIDGRDRKVLMHAPKNGFFYVIDRTNGELVSAEPYVKVTWATHIDKKTGRPVENPDARYRDKPFLIWPGPTGAHNWLPMAYSPKSRLVYLPASESAAEFGNTAINPLPPEAGEGSSRLIAWDPVAQKPVWTIDTTGVWGGGVMATGGNLVFQGEIDHSFNAYDAASGKRLWRFDAKAPVIAPPISYAVDGVQYVTVMTGYGVSVGTFAQRNPAFQVDYRTMPRRVLTFAIGGKAVLPAVAPRVAKLPPSDPTFRPDPARSQLGRVSFAMNCSLCHGFDAIAGGAAPDLRVSQVIQTRDVFHDVVSKGILLEQGMPHFKTLPSDSVEDIRFYLRTRAQELPVDQTQTNVMRSDGKSATSVGVLH